MSAPEKLSRRALLGLFRRTAPDAAPAPAPLRPASAAPPPGDFSLEAFYRARRTGPLPPVPTGDKWVVQVRQSTCLAWQGSFCTVCAERCPVEGALILEQGRPRVEPASCTGCGVCIQVCPAPINGLTLRPHERDR